MTTLYLGEIEAALRHIERAIAIRDPISSSLASAHNPLVLVHMFYGFALVLSGRAEEGWASAESGVQLARTVEMPMYLGSALSLAADLASVRRDLVGSRQFATVALAYGKEKSLVNWAEMNRAVLGWVQVLETRDAQWIEPLREAVEAFGATRNAAASRLFSLLADAYLAVERIDEAARALDSAFDLRRAERLYDAHLLHLRAMILLARARSASSSAAGEEAVQALVESIEVAKKQGALLFRLRSTVELCRLSLKAGKRAEAGRSLTEVLGLFNQGFVETDLREARALLADIEAGA